MLFKYRTDPGLLTPLLPRMFSWGRGAARDSEALGPLSATWVPAQQPRWSPRPPSAQLLGAGVSSLACRGDAPSPTLQAWSSPAAGAPGSPLPA